MVLLRIAEKFFASLSECVERLVVSVVQNLFLKELPQALNGIPVGCIRRERNERDAGMSKIRLDSARVIVTRVVGDDINVGGKGIKLFDLLNQRDGRVGVDGIVEAHHRLQTPQVDHTVDVDTPPCGVGAHLMLLAALDPAVAERGIILRVDRVHEADDVVPAIPNLRP